MNTLKSFVHEIWNFLHTITIFDPYMLSYYDDIVKVATGQSVVPIEENPYIVNMLGENYKHPDPEFAHLNDEPIMITSHDRVGESFVLSRSNLEGSDATPGHPVTLNNYRSTPRLFKALCGKYPNRAGFIKACFFPVEPESLFVDEVIQIISADDADSGTRFILTPSNLASHPKTMDLYVGDLYNNLLDRYPERSDYIEKCFTLSELDQDIISQMINYSTISAKPFELIAHGADYVLPDYEAVSIVNAVRKYLEKHSSRWNIPEYIANEKYAHTVYWIGLLSLLNQVVYRQRVRNVNTSMAHRDVIWLFLGSHGLSDYRDILSRSQELFLYKNIRHLKATRGSKYATKLIVENLLKPDGIDLFEKQLVLDTTNMAEDTLPTPIIITQSVSKNTGQYSWEDFVNTESIQDIYARELEDELEPGHGKNLLEDQEYLLAHSRSTRLPTKLLEMRTGKYGIRRASAYFSFAFESIGYWLSLKTDGEPTIDFKLSVRLSDNLGVQVLTIREAFALVYYFMRQYLAPSITITANNRNSYIGKTVLIDNALVTLTEMNIDSYAANQDIVLVGPVNAPVSSHMTRPFKEGSQDVQLSFNHHESVRNLAEFVDMSAIGNRPITAQVNSTRKLTTMLDDQFSVRLSDVEAIESSGSVLVRTAYEHLYGQTVLNDKIYHDWGNVSEYASVDEWINDSDMFSALRDEINSKSNRALACEDLVVSLIKTIIDVDSSKYLSKLPHSTLRYGLMRQMLIQLCTYDVAFLNTESQIFEPVYGFKTYIDNDYGDIIEEKSTVYAIPHIGSSVTSGIIMGEWPSAGQPLGLVGRADDNLIVDATLRTDAMEDGFELESCGSQYAMVNGEIVNEESVVINLTPAVGGNVQEGNGVSINPLPSIAHLDAVVDTVVPPVKPPYPENDPGTLPEDVVEYPVNVRGTEMDKVEETLVHEITASGEITENAEDVLSISTTITGGEIFNVNNVVPPWPPNCTDSCSDVCSDICSDWVCWYDDLELYW